ncbi:MAG: hypothetical protein FD147_1012 [Chloroflexi bacterium]|nr:MAG: hypothetical protein FD147_1012 [Chloroflexota bacterium]MBA4374900.1 hypothetical protein [Anaerolinea sp.]
MRITRELLINLAHENAAKMSAKERGLVCVYLTGSLLKAEPFLGGVTDIDVICVHDRPVTTAREIIRINADVHLDLAHYTQDDFLPARKLRTDAWIGGALENDPLILQDSAHWFDLTRSNATSQFWQPANVAARAGSFITFARQNWLALQDGSLPQGIKRIQALLDVIRDTANAAAALNGMPLPIRRLFLELPERAAKAGIPELAGELVQIFTSDEVTDEHWSPWLAGWMSAFDALKTEKDAPAAIHPNRRNYYEKAVEALTADRPAAALWIILRTWTKASAALPKSGTPYKEWQNMCHQLNLEAKNLPQRLDALDAALDLVEEVVDAMRS